MTDKPIIYRQIDMVVDAFMSNGELDRIESLFPSTIPAKSQSSEVRVQRYDYFSGKPKSQLGFTKLTIEQLQR